MPRRDKRLLGYARENRRAMPAAETRLWEKLRAGRLADIKFTRQVQIGPYIADFAARRAKLVVELDGDSHLDRVAPDALRTAFLESQGYTVLRFWNQDVLDNIDGVLEHILHAHGRR